MKYKLDYTSKGNVVLTAYFEAKEWKKISGKKLSEQPNGIIILGYALYFLLDIITKAKK